MSARIEAGRPAGVIAAGRGERLRSGAAPFKPLVSVGGRTLIEHVLASVAETAPSEVVVIVNEASTAVRDHVSSRRWPFPVRWIVETTPSSMHSFLRVVETLAEGGDRGPFLMSTVDTIAPAGAYARFADAAAEADADVVLAVTAVSPDDDTPLLVLTDDPGGAEGPAAGGSRRARPVRAIGTAAAGASLATAGYYSVRPSILGEAAAARRDGVTALRLFLGRLLAKGYRLAAVPVDAGVDVDRPADVGAAEAFLKQVAR